MSFKGFCYKKVYENSIPLFFKIFFFTFFSELVEDIITNLYQLQTKLNLLWNKLLLIMLENFLCGQDKQD